MFDWNALHTPRIPRALQLSVLIFIGAVYLFLPGISTAMAAADTAADLSVIRTYIDQGQATQAVEALEKRTKETASDYQAWFLLGIAYTNLKKFDKAIQAFHKVSELQPDLAEPHNNLAVIHNEQGNYKAAVQELETSLQKSPDYPVAEENLGDLYTKLALQHYRKALDKKPSPSLQKRYQDLIQAMNFKTVATSGGDKPVEKSDGSTAAVKVLARGSSAIDDTPVADKQLNDSDVSEPETSPQATSDGQPGLKTDAADSSTTNMEQILSVVESWRKAWSEKDMSTYFGHYASDFQTLPKFPSMDLWEKYKRRVISGSKFIKVELDEIRIEIDATGSKANVRFGQHFSNGKISETDIKTLLMEKQNDAWKIVREHAAPFSGNLDTAKESAEQVASDETTVAEEWAVNVASFRTRKQAEDTSQKLNLDAPYFTYITNYDGSKGHWFRLRVGFFKTKLQAKDQMQHFSLLLKTSPGWVLKPGESEISNAHSQRASQASSE